LLLRVTSYIFDGEEFFILKASDSLAKLG
jgi:hypothetical protein